MTMGCGTGARWEIGGEKVRAAYAGGRPGTEKMPRVHRAHFHYSWMMTDFSSV
jgi:hypothetical protein